MCGIFGVALKAVNRTYQWRPIPEVVRLSFSTISLVLALSQAFVTAAVGQQTDVASIMAGRAKEADAAYDQSRFSALSKDYISRFSRDPAARATQDEVEIKRCIISLPEQPSAVARNIANLLRDFLVRNMGVPTEIATSVDPQLAGTYTIEFIPPGPASPVSAGFQVQATSNTTSIRGAGDDAVRDGTVHLINKMGLRRAPILKLGTQTLQPKLELRLGSVPWLGSMRDAVLLGYNAVLIKPHVDLHAISTAKALPEITYLQSPDVLAQVARTVSEARAWGLRAYVHLNNRSRFPDDHPFFKAHPESMGPRVWNGYGGHILSTESPSVRRYIAETISGLFTAVPDVSGILMIVGGEGFYHCYMHPLGRPKGQTDTSLCGPRGPEETVANLINTVFASARAAKRDADVIAWPYSAQFVWSGDPYQADFMARLQPGASIATEVENGEVTGDPDGLIKFYWDYSLGMIGPSQRAVRQIALAKNNRLRVYLHSEPELSLDFGGLPFVPSPPRWLARSRAVAASGADGILAMAYFNNFYGSAGAQIAQFAWWDGVGEPEEIRHALARSIAGDELQQLEQAWDLISQAISLSPQIPIYFRGPTFLGPAHPLMLDPEQDIAPVFHGRFLYLVESSELEALNLDAVVDRIPQVHTVVRVRDDGTVEAENPPGNSISSFGRRYRAMLKLVDEAVDSLEQATSAKSNTSNIMFASELSIARWFQETLRSTANFYEAYELRNCARNNSSDLSKHDRMVCHEKLVMLVQDEVRNTQAALQTVLADVRLDVYFQPFLGVAHTSEMIKAKLRLLDREEHIYLPALAKEIAAASSK
jgi:hypothetical protein